MNTSTRKATSMKTMTCRDLGGPCDLAHTGASADDVINAQDKHLKEIVRSGDTAHQEAADAMKARWRNPIKGMGRYKSPKKFAALPEVDQQLADLLLLVIHERGGGDVPSGRREVARTVPGGAC